MNKNVPKYAQIMNYYITKIKNKELIEGQKLPTEDEICKLFNVSRITVRQALDEIARLGYIVRIQGKGSYIGTSKTQLQLNKLQGFSEEMISKGLKPSTELVEIVLITPDSNVAEKLKIDQMVKVYSIIRIRSTDNIPMAVEHSYVPFYLCNNLEEQDLTKSMYEIFEKKYNFKVTHARQSIEAILIDKYNARLLNIEPLQQALKIERISYTNDGIPCEFVTSVYRGDKYKFYVDLERK